MYSIPLGCELCQHKDETRSLFFSPAPTTAPGTVKDLNKCFSPFELLYQNTTDWVAYKQQKFISHSSGGWEVQDQGTTIVGFW